ncbi:hypothetical protein [Paraburkholderia strydomiana]
MNVLPTKNLNGGLWAESGSSRIAMSPREVGIQRQHRERYFLKYDGFRCLVRKTDERVGLVLREGNPVNRSLREVVVAIR